MKIFADAVAETSEFVDRAVARIGTGREALLEAQELRTHLINLLELARRDPGLDAAADDLNAACLACARAAESGGIDPRQRRLLQEAASRLKERVSAAKPAEVMQRRGLRP